MHRRVRRIIPFILAVLGACASNDSLDPLPVAGEYELRTVNGASLPVAGFSNDGGNIETVSEAIQLRSDGVFAMSGVLRLKAQGAEGQSPYSNRGSFERDGDTLRLRFANGQVLGATVKAGVMTIKVGVNERIYRKKP